jgi:flavin-binding protein dodecin
MQPSQRGWRKLDLGGTSTDSVGHAVRTTAIDRNDDELGEAQVAYT